MGSHTSEFWRATPNSEWNGYILFFVLEALRLSSHMHLSFSPQLVRVLVSPTNPPGATTSCQKAMFHCGLLQQLCTILMATGVPADILTEVRGSKFFHCQDVRLNNCVVWRSLLLLNYKICNYWPVSFFLCPLCRPLTLCQRSSEAARWTRTTLPLWMHRQTHRGRGREVYTCWVMMCCTGNGSVL